MLLSNKHVFNINRALKDIKLDVMADFICTDNRGLIIITNKVVSTLNLITMKKYIKNVSNIDLEDILSPRLFQLKFYFKILGISYLLKDTNVTISSDIVKRVLHSSHIFNDIVLTSKPYIIKAFLKLNITVIQINIWNAQSSVKAKKLINRCFNIRSYIIMVRSTNINLGIPYQDRGK